MGEGSGFLSSKAWNMLKNVVLIFWLRLLVTDQTVMLTMTTPTPDGSGAAKAIKLAINEAGIKPEDVDYVNAHGTSTPANEKGGKWSYCFCTW